MVVESGFSRALERIGPPIARAGVFWVLLAGLVLPGGSRALQAASRPVQFVTSDGVTIAATFGEPAQEPAPAVLLLHMQTRSRVDWDDLARRLNDAGFCTLAIDFRGHGESTMRAVEGALREFTVRDFEADGTDYRKMVLDVAGARDFLRAQPGVNAARIAFVGASIGANVAAVAAAADPAVRSLVLLSAGVDYRRLRGDEALLKFGARPALLVASREDRYATQSAERLATIGKGPRELKILDGAGHGTVMLARDPSLAAAIVDWLRRTVYY